MTVRALLLVASSTAALPAPARAGQLLGGLLDKPLSNLVSALPRGTTRVIIRTDRGALSPVLRLVTALGGRVLVQHKLIDALTVELPLVQLALVVRLPGVLSVSLDSPVASAPIVDIGPAESHLAETLGLPEAGPPPHRARRPRHRRRRHRLGAVGQRRLPDPPLRRLHQGRPTARPYTENAQPADDYGHGTHVGGLIAGSGVGSNGNYRGVAPGAALVGLKVLDANGAGRTSDVLSAIEYAVANRDALGLRVLNLSLGHPIFEPADRDPLVQAVEAAVAPA